MDKKIKLDEISKKSPFKVPENYFEDFASRMEAHLSREVKKVSLFHKLRPYMFIAAVIAVMLSVTFVVFRNGNQDKALLAKNQMDTLAPKDLAAKTVASPVANNKKEPVVTKEDDSEAYLDDVDNDGQFDDIYAELNNDDDI